MVLHPFKMQNVRISNATLAQTSDFDSSLLLVVWCHCRSAVRIFHQRPNTTLGVPPQRRDLATRVPSAHSLAAGPCHPTHCARSVRCRTGTSSALHGFGSRLLPRRLRNQFTHSSDGQLRHRVLQE